MQAGKAHTKIAKHNDDEDDAIGKVNEMSGPCDLQNVVLLAKRSADFHCIMCNANVISGVMKPSPLLAVLQFCISLERMILLAFILAFGSWIILCLSNCRFNLNNLLSNVQFCPNVPVSHVQPSE